MKVWVVVADCGLNGPAIMAVYGHEPTAEEMRAAERKNGGVTGYSGTYAEERDVQP